jgi:hypothetical protein
LSSWTDNQQLDAPAALWTMSPKALLAFADRGEGEAVAVGLELLRRERIRHARTVVLADTRSAAC